MYKIRKDSITNFHVSCLPASFNYLSSLEQTIFHHQCYTAEKVLDMDFDSILHNSYVPLSKVLALCEFKKKLFIHFRLCWVFLAVHGLSLVKASGGYSSDAVRRLLVAVAFLAAEHRCRACGLP